MITTKLYLNIQKIKDDGTSPLFYRITSNRNIAYISMGISVNPTYWDNKTLEVVGIASKVIQNKIISNKKLMLDNIISSIKDVNRMSAKEIKKLVEEQLYGIVSIDNLITPRFIAYTDNISTRTKQIYLTTLRKLQAYDKDFDRLTFEDINLDWLKRFDRWMMKGTPSANGRAIHMRNLRAIFNDAINNDITNNYPFRKFKIKVGITRKRSYSVETLRRILTAECKEEWQIKYLDFFKLTFYLIGINAIDLIHLNIYKDGRIEYTRAKTHKPYSIKVEPEAEELINKYKGKKYLLNYMDSNSNYRCFYFNMTKGLHSIKKDLVANGVEIEELTTYWARHTWATIASELDIPKDTIAAALGHGGNSVTDIYINFDIKKVDEANRKVLDYVLYNKK